MPVPQRVDFPVVERALGPVHQRLIDNGATSQLELTSEFGRFGNRRYRQSQNFTVSRQSY
ncbi:hypothetical protein QUA79_13630 [Microcoleus sp. F8-D1]